MGASCVTKDGNEILWVDTVVTLDKLKRNVRSDQSLDDSVVNLQRKVVADYPSIIKFGNKEWQFSVIKNKRGDSPKGGMPTYHRQQWFV